MSSIDLVQKNLYNIQQKRNQDIFNSLYFDNVNEMKEFLDAIHDNQTLLENYYHEYETFVFDEKIYNTIEDKEHYDYIIDKYFDDYTQGGKKILEKNVSDDDTFISDIDSVSKITNINTYTDDVKTITLNNPFNEYNIVSIPTTDFQYYEHYYKHYYERDGFTYIFDDRVYNELITKDNIYFDYFNDVNALFFSIIIILKYNKIISIIRVSKENFKELTDINFLDKCFIFEITEDKTNSSVYIKIKSIL